MPVGNPVTDLSTTGNFVPITRTLTINGVSYDLSADRSWSIASPGGGSVTSVAMSVPVGFSISGSPITTAGTLAVTFSAGYALPTTVKQSNWDDAYTFVSNFPSQTGNNGKFLYTSGSVLSWQPVLQNPMSNYGEMIFGGTSGVPSVVSPNITVNRKYLQQIGNGTAAFAPSWGGIISSDITGAALTSSNDTNIQITLGGTPGNSVLNAVSLTMGWTGQLSAGRGGTGTSGVTGIMLGNSTAPVTGITGIGGQILRVNPSTSAYEFWTSTYLESPLTTLGDIIYGGAGGQPLRLGANNTANNMYLRSVSSGIPSWASIQGADIVGAGISRTNDVNVQLTLGGATTDGLLRAVTLTMGWTGQLAVPRGGTGASSLTGVVIGNSTGAMTAVAGTAEQLLRRNAANSAYEFFTPTFLSNPFTAANQIIYSNSANAPLTLNPNATANNLFLRSVSSGAPSWAAVTGADITGAALTAANDTNVTITLGGTPSTALLRAASITLGWTGVLSPSRGGTGATTLTGVVIGNGIGTMTGVVGTAEQLLRRNAANSAYEFFTPTFLSNPMTSLGDIIYGNAAGAPVRLAANSSGSNQYLRSVSSGAPGWASIVGSDVTGAAITTANDTNILITASGNSTNSLLRTMTLTAGWTGQLVVGRGGTGASTLTGVLIGNGTSAFTGITGTASQILRRNAANTEYEFYTASLLTSSGTTNFVPIWTNSSVLGNSPLSITGGEANFGSNKLVSGNVSATDGSIMLQDNYSSGHLGNIGTMYSGGNLMMGYCVTPSTSSATGFLSSTTLTLPKSAIVAGEDIFFYTASAQSIAIGSAVSMSERLKVFNNGQLKLGAYTSTSSFTGIVQGYLAFTSGGLIVTTATPGGVSGTQNYLAKFDSTGIAVGNSRIVDDGTNFLLNGATSVVTGLNLVGNMSATESQGGSILLRRSAVPTSGQTLGLLDAYGITTGSTYQQGGGIEFRASQNWNSTSAGTELAIQTAPDNTIAPADMFVFLNNGAVRFIGRTSNPIGAAAGTMYYNSSANNMRYYNGTSWITF